MGERPGNPEILYMEDADANYIREFEAEVTGAGDGWVTLDRTAFYAKGGGQPTDTGELRWRDPGGEGLSARVREVVKKDGVRHVLEGDVLPPVGTRVRGLVDWDRRHAHMRMHTAQHLISGVVYDLFGARTVGNQIHAQTSRIDFSPARFTSEDLERIQARCNEVIDEALPVSVYEEDRESVMSRVDPIRSSMDMIPESVRRLRMVDIGGGRDLCPCAGTHVRDLSELGHIRILKKENKGRDRERVVYELVPPGGGQARD